MSKIEFPRERLSPQDIELIQFLYCKKGWTGKHIALKLFRNRATIHYQIKRRKLKREVPQVTAIPEEILGAYVDDFVPISDDPIVVGHHETKTYAQYLEDMKQRKKEECNHLHWVQRCSICGQIMDSDGKH